MSPWYRRAEPRRTAKRISASSGTAAPVSQSGPSFDVGEARIAQDRRRIAARLKSEPSEIIADRYEEASVLFADLAGFTRRASRQDPETLVRFLNDIYGEFDRLVDAYGLEKVKTSGDAYIVVSGVPGARPDHAIALALRDRAAMLTDAGGKVIEIRIGIASGSLVAGVVGTRKFFYDVWGDAVNLASRMEQTGEPGKVQLAGPIRKLLAGEFVLEPRGPVSIKGKGRMRCWFLISRKMAAAIRSTDTIPPSIAS